MDINAIATEAFENELELAIGCASQVLEEFAKKIRILADTCIEALETIVAFFREYAEKVIRPVIKEFRAYLMKAKREYIYVQLRFYHLPHWLAFRVSMILPEWFIERLLVR